MFSGEILKPSVELLLSESPDVRILASDSCYKLFPKYGKSLLKTLFDAIKENFEENSDKCNTLFDVISRISDSDQFNEENVVYVSNQIMKLFENFGEKEHECTKTASNLILHYAKSNANVIYPIFTSIFDSDVPINWTYLYILQKCISLRDGIIGSYINDILKHILDQFSRPESEKFRNIFLDVFLSALQVIDTNNIPPAFSGIYRAVFSKCLDDESVQQKAFRLLSVAVAAVDPLDSASILYGVGSRLAKFLEDPQICHAASTAVAALLFRSECDSPEFSRAAQQMAQPVLGYIARSFPEYAEQAGADVMRGVPEAMRSVQVIFRHAGSGIVEAALTKGGDAGLAILSHVLQGSSNNSKFKESSKVVTFLNNVFEQKKMSMTTKALALELFARLVGVGADTSMLSKGALRTAASAPSLLGEFERQLLSCVENNELVGMLDAALDTKNVAAARTAFVAMRKASNQQTTTLPRDTVIVRTLFYALSPFFPPKARADLLFVAGTAISNQEFLAAAAVIKKHGCQACAHREAKRLLIEAARVSSVAEQWLADAQALFEEVQKPNPETGRPPFGPSSCSQFRAALFSFESAILSLPEFQAQANRLQKLLLKSETRYADEATQLAADLKAIGDWTPLSLQPKNPSKSFQLDFQSRFASVAPGTLETLFDEDVSPLIASKAQRRILKTGRTFEEAERHSILISRLLSSPAMTVCKAAIDSLLLLPKENVPEAILTNCLRRAVAVIAHSPELSEKVEKLIDSVKPLIAFDSITNHIFSGGKFADTAIDILVEFIKRNKKPLDMRSAHTAADTAILLMHEEYKEQAGVVAGSVFMANKPAKEFALQYFGYHDTDKAQMIHFLISGLLAASPFSSYAASIIETIAEKSPDAFQGVLKTAMSSLHTFSSYAKAPDGLAPTAELLFAKDRTSFVNALLDHPMPAPPVVLNLLSSRFAVFGQSLIDVACRAPVSESFLHDSVVKVIARSAIPEASRVAALTFIALVIAQSRRSCDACIAAVGAMKRYFPGLACADYALDGWRCGGDSMDCLEAMFSVIKDDLTMYYLSPFVKFAPAGAVIGYGAIMHQGRPLLFDILKMKDQCPEAIVRVCPLLKVLSPERYGSDGLTQLLNLLLQQKAFGAIESLFSWLPSDVIVSNAKALFSAVSKVMKEKQTPMDVYRLIGHFTENLAIISLNEFKASSPMFYILSILKGCIDKEARATAILLAQQSGWSGAANSIKEASQLAGKEYLIAALPKIVQEMDVTCLDCTFSIIDDRESAVRIEAAMVICATVHYGRFAEKRPHSRLVTMLSENETVKCGVLDALKRFPPILY